MARKSAEKAEPKTDAADLERRIQSLANEARHLARKEMEAAEAALVVDTEAAERLGWPHLIVEVLTFTEPLTFVYHELVPSLESRQEIPLSDQGFWSAKDKGTYARTVSPMLDLERQVERHKELASAGFLWVPWWDLPARLRWWISAHILPHSWRDPESVQVLDPAKSDLVKVFVQGNLP